MDELISWLHISDRHTCSPTTGWDANRVISTLVADLKRLQERGLRPNLLFFTGDLAWGQIGAKDGKSIAEQFAESEQFLDAIRNTFDPPIPKENTFLVPGNHDINRDHVAEQDTSYLDQERSADAITKLIAEKKLSWKRYMERLQDYKQYLETSGYTHLLSDKDRLIYSAIREIGGRKVGIAGFNSAWSCCRSQEKSKLWIGGHFQSEVLLGQLEGTDFNIALVHHPGAWYRDEESNLFWRHRIQERFEVCLHGHEHDAWVTQMASGHVLIAAGACYERSDHKMEYSLVRLFPREQRGEVWLRTYDDRGRGGWKADVIPDKTDHNGVWYLEGLPWLWREDDPLGTGGPPTAPTEPDGGVSLLESKAGQIAEAVRSIMGPELETLAKQPSNSTTVKSNTRVQRVGSNTTIVYNTFVQLVLPINSITSSTDPSEQTLTKQLLEEIDRLIDTYKLEDAYRRLTDFETQHGSSLSDRDRYRIHVKRGHVHYHNRRINDAIAAFREGLKYVPPADPYARYFTAHIAELEEDSSTAFSIADQLLQTNPEFHSEAIISLWIRNAPATKSIAEIEERFGEMKCNDTGIAYTLARRAAEDGQYELAEQYGRIAAKGRPEWTDARTALATTLMGKRFGKIVTAGHSRPPIERWPDFAEIESLWSVGVAEIERGQAPEHAAVIRLNLGMLYTAIGDVETATLQYRKAFEQAPEDRETVRRLALSMARAGNDNEAIALLRESINATKDLHLALLLAELLGSQVSNGKRSAEALNEAVALLDAGRDKLEDIDAQHREDWVSVLIQLLVDIGDLSKARSTLRSSAQHLTEARAKFLAADIEDAAGDKAAAVKAATEAVDALPGKPDPPTARHIAAFLEHLEQYALAMKVWGKLATFHELGVDESHYIDSAQRAGALEELVSASQTLRSNGVWDKQLFLVEIGALQQISQERLLIALQQMLAATEDEVFRRELRTYLSSTAFFLQKLDFVDSDPERLPRVGEVRNAPLGLRVVEVLRRGKDSRLAITYAYELYRRFPDAPESHIAVLYSTGFPGHDPERKPEEPSVCGPGSAVLYKESDADEPEWAIIEDAANPSLSRNEHAPTDRLAIALQGKHAGESFTYRSSPLGTATGQVLKIVSKYSYRWLDCINNFEKRFPEHHVVWKSNPEDANADGLIRHLEQRAKQIEQLNEIYRTHKTPLDTFGQALGKSVFEAVHHIVANRTLSLLCCHGTSDEEVAARQAVTTTNAFVIDSTAIATLFLLDSTEVVPARTILESVPVPVYVSELALADIRETLMRLAPREHLTMSTIDSKLVSEVTSDAAARKQYDQLRQFVVALQTICKVVPAQITARENAEWFKKLEDYIGAAAAETVRIAVEKDAVLWTDELITSELARPEIGLRRIWTRMLTDRLWEERHILHGRKEDVPIFLYLAGYRFTALNSDVLRVAAERSDWRVTGILKEILKQYAEPTLTAGSLVRTSSTFLLQMWQARGRGKLQDQSRRITCYLFNQFAKRPDVVASVSRVATSVLGSLQYDSELAKNFRRAYRSWKRPSS